jgi:hypothetical protein
MLIIFRRRFNKGHGSGRHEVAPFVQLFSAVIRQALLEGLYRFIYRFFNSRAGLATLAASKGPERTDPGRILHGTRPYSAATELCRYRSTLSCSSIASGFRLRLGRDSGNRKMARASGIKSGLRSFSRVGVLEPHRTFEGGLPRGPCHIERSCR